MGRKKTNLLQNRLRPINERVLAGAISLSIRQWSIVDELSDLLAEQARMKKSTRSMCIRFLVETYGARIIEELKRQKELANQGVETKSE